MIKGDTKTESKTTYTYISPEFKSSPKDPDDPYKMRRLIDPDRFPPRKPLTAEELENISPKQDLAKSQGITANLTRYATARAVETTTDDIIPDITTSYSPDQLLNPGGDINPKQTSPSLVSITPSDREEISNIKGLSQLEGPTTYEELESEIDDIFSEATSPSSRKRTFSDAFDKNSGYLSDIIEEEKKEDMEFKNIRSL